MHNPWGGRLELASRGPSLPPQQEEEERYEARDPNAYIERGHVAE